MVWLGFFLVKCWTFLRDINEQWHRKKRLSRIEKDIQVIYIEGHVCYETFGEEKKKTFGKYDNIFNMQNRNFHAISEACFLDIWKLDLEKTGIDRMPMTFNIVSLSLPPTIMNFTLRNVTNRAWNFSLCRYL